VTPFAPVVRSVVMRRLLLGLLAAAALVPASAAAAGPQPPNCPLLAPREAVDHPLTLPDGTKVVARDPYGGLLSRNRLFFQFGLRKPAGLGAPRGIAEVTWALDGTVVRTDPTPPYDWRGLSGSDRRMPAGDHRITVSVAPAGGGAAVSTNFALNATDCQPATAFASIDESLSGGSHPSGGSQLDASSTFESRAGPTMTSVAFTGAGFSTRVPRSSRGHAAGTLTVSGGPSGTQSYRLRVQRVGTTLLRRGSLRVTVHPGARRFLTVTGLPAGTHAISARLVGRGARGVFVKHRTGANRCRYSTTAAIAGPEGKVVVVSGGTSSGLCR
jgi:hypothetical protein